MVCIVSVLAILKKHYTKFINCLPQDGTKTMGKIRQLGIPDDILSYLKIEPSCINAAIILMIMRSIKEESDVLEIFDLMEILCENDASKGIISTIRNGMNIVHFLLTLCVTLNEHRHLFYNFHSDNVYYVNVLVLMYN